MRVNVKDRINELQYTKSLDTEAIKKPEIQSKTIKETPKSAASLTSAEIQDARRRKRNWWYLTSLLSGAATGWFIKQAGDIDAMGRRMLIQDVTTNVGMAEQVVQNPKASLNQFMEFAKETACFAAPILLVLPKIVNWARDGKIPDNTHHFYGNFLGLDKSVALGAAAPLAISEALGYFLNKADPKKDLTKEELKKQQVEVNKTYAAAGLATLLKAGLLGVSIMREPKPGDHKLVGHAIAFSSLLNTVKTAANTYLTHNSGKKVRHSKSVTPVFFDGVVAQSVANILDIGLNKQLGIPNTARNVAIQSLIGGIISLGGINVVKHTLDPLLTSMFGQSTPQTEEEKVKPK